MADAISATTVGRWLDQDAIKPWQHRSWIFPRDPDFAAKAGPVLDLYDRRWDGVELGPDEYVISADEKSQLQALHRRHPAQLPRPGRIRREEFEYRRGGTLAYFAAYDVHRAHVIGHIAPKTGIEPFADLVALAERVLAYREDRYNTAAAPFDWTYTREDLNAFIRHDSERRTHPPQRPAA